VRARAHTHPGPLDRKPPGPGPAAAGGGHRGGGEMPCIDSCPPRLPFPASRAPFVESFEPSARPCLLRPSLPYTVRCFRSRHSMFFFLLQASLLSTSISFTLPSYEKTREVQQVPILKFAVVRRTENDENFNVEFDKDETVGIWSRYQ